MKLGDIINFIEPITFVVIWTNEDDDEPIFTGNIIDMPWYLLDYNLDKPNKNSDAYGIDFRDNLGEKYGNRPGMVMSLTYVEEDE